jgi:hypothetical protein
MINILGKKNKSCTKRGFTLVETFVAVTILMIAVLGPMYLLSQALASALYIKNDIIAGHLAQEGLEATIAYSRTGGASAWFSSNADDGTKKFKVDLTNPSIVSPDFCPGNDCGYLKLSPSKGYGYASGVDTIFRREITIKKVDDGQYKTSSTVYRKERNSPIERSISSVSYIFK